MDNRGGGLKMNNDLISRSELKKVLNEMFDTFDVILFDDILETIDNAPTALFPLTVTINDKVTIEDIELLKRLMRDYKPQVLNLEMEANNDDKQGSD